MIKSPDSGWIQILLFIKCVILAKWLNSSVPQFPHLKNVDSNCIWVWELSGILDNWMYAKCLKQYLANSKQLLLTMHRRIDGAVPLFPKECPSLDTFLTSQIEIMGMAMLQSRPHRECGDDESLSDYWAGAQVPSGEVWLCVLPIS